MKPFLQLFLIPLLFFIAATEIFSQCPGLSQIRSGAAFVNDITVGSIAWANTGNAGNEDDAYATATTATPAAASNYLKATDFGFAIPAGSTICGIRVKVERLKGGIAQAVKDNSVRIVKGGTISGTDLADLITEWPTTDGPAFYGNGVEQWGETWTVSDVNSAGFGVGISASLNVSATPSALIDHIEVSVFYDPPALPVEWTELEGKAQVDHAMLTWSTASEVNNDFFSVERSEDGQTFIELARITGKGNTTETSAYSYSDHSCPANKVSYYRIRQNDLNGGYSYSHQISLSLPGSGIREKDIIIYPNPFGDAGFYLENLPSCSSISIALVDISGRVRHARDITECGIGAKSVMVIPGDLPGGVYMALVYCNQRIFSKKIMHHSSIYR